MVYSQFASVFRPELAFALDICERAGSVAMKYFKQGIESEAKADGTPVTRADKECEALIREAICDRFPEDGILGEEEGEKNGVKRRRRWIIDPIDGTYGFARGIPIFATLLALEEEGAIVLGIVHAPALGETFWAEKGRGAFKNGERIKVSTIDRVEKAHICFGAINRICNSQLWSGFSELMAKSGRQRGFGDYYGFGLVFEGKAEANIETGLKPWDLAPMKIIVEEAGGRYSDLAGGESIEIGSCLVSNGLVHNEILSQLKL